MELNAIYDKGRVKFIQPVRFVRDRINIRIVVSDDDVVPMKNGQSEPMEARKSTFPYDLEGQSQRLRERLDRIRHAPLPPNDAIPPLTEKQTGRMEAFAHRGDLRRER
ncbi:MAG: hypothetical protein JRJ82_22575 [Deltaproteobacteria bacterium]|nr:hypothetical protein [Deltaproteobacteria bacterium]